MRKFLSAVIVIPFAIVLIALAVANRHFITVSFDPLNTADPALTAQIPLYALILGVAIVGVIAGGCGTWFGQSQWRRAARHHRADAEAARSELAGFKAAALSTQRAPSQRLIPVAQAEVLVPYGRDKRTAAL